MSASVPSDDDVRAKAYQLWLAGGMAHGHDLEDWTEAKEILSQDDQTSAPSDVTAAKAEQRVSNEEKAKLEGLVVQNGPPPKTKDEPGAATATITPDSDLPKVNPDPGV
jgi:Protein of unknown function (DUF2934)